MSGRPGGSYYGQRGNYRGSSYRGGYHRHNSNGGSPYEHSEYERRPSSSSSSSDSRGYRNGYYKGGSGYRGSYEHRGGRGHSGNGTNRYDEDYSSTHNLNNNNNNSSTTGNSRYDQTQPHYRHPSSSDRRPSDRNGRSVSGESRHDEEKKHSDSVSLEERKKETPTHFDLRLLDLDKVSAVDQDFKDQYVNSSIQEEEFDKELFSLTEEILKKNQEIEGLQRLLSKTSYQVELTRESLNEISLL